MLAAGGHVCGTCVALRTACLTPSMTDAHAVVAHRPSGMNAGPRARHPPLAAALS